MQEKLKIKKGEPMMPKEETIADANTNPHLFWCCFVEGTKNFAVKHTSYILAQQEAERLAALPENTNRKVYVLQALTYCICIKTPSWEWKRSE